MKLSASQAAKEVGKSVPTITRAIKNGKITAEKLDGGGYKIDRSELFRVWPAVTNEDDVTPKDLGDVSHSATSDLRAEVKRLREQIDIVGGERDRERQQMKETIEDLRVRLDAESIERRALTARITDQREKSAKPLRKKFLGIF